MDVTAKLNALSAALRQRAPLAIAFSGGLDSRFLAHMARRSEVQAVLLHIAGPHVPPAESRAALAWARAAGLDCLLCESDPLQNPAVAANGKDRCYHCKRGLFSLLREKAAGLGNGQFLLCDGTNASDLGQFRPGLRALRELDVWSPLAEGGFTKEDIRAAAALTGLDNPGQRARPCLLTRFAYGLAPTREALAALAEAEEALASLLERHASAPAVPDFRLRLFSSAGQGTYAAELHLDAPVPSGLSALLTAEAATRGFTLGEPRVLDGVGGYHDSSGG